MSWLISNGVGKRKIRICLQEKNNNAKNRFYIQKNEEKKFFNLTLWLYVHNQIFFHLWSSVNTCENVKIQIMPLKEPSPKINLKTSRTVWKILLFSKNITGKLQILWRYLLKWIGFQENNLVKFLASCPNLVFISFTDCRPFDDVYHL